MIHSLLQAHLCDESPDGTVTYYRSGPSPRKLVSNDRANIAATRLCRGVVTVVPVTSNTDEIFPFQVLPTASANGLIADSKAQAEQVRSIAVHRLSRQIGQMPIGSEAFAASCQVALIRFRYVRSTKIPAPS